MTAFLDWLSDYWPIPAAVFFVAILILAVCSVSSDPYIQLDKESWNCAHSHAIYVPIVTGKTTVLLPENICDVWRMNGY